MKKRILIVASVAAAAAAFATCSPLYVLRAGYEEALILSRRQPIERVVASPATDAETRRKLALVQQARAFAVTGLDLDAGDSYTTFSRLDRDTLALVLSAARKDAFEQVTWWFPIVGHVPYKGFFSLDAARDAAARLDRDGYDTYIRPTGAFSTLGWFNDPVLSTVLRADDVALVATVVHELTHNTLYLPSQVAFNESFASFVGDRGAIAFFCGLEGDDGPRCRLARDRWADNLLFAEHLRSLIADLEALYARGDLSTAEKIRRRDDVFDRARERFLASVQPRLRTADFRGFHERAPLNNATLIAWRLYFDRLALFEAAFERSGRDLQAAVHRIRRIAEDAGGDPFAALEAALREAGDETPFARGRSGYTFGVGP